MKIKHLLISALCLFIAAGTVSCGKQEKVTTITVASDATWPPMEMINKDKKIEGYAIDFFNAVGKEAGIKFEFKNTAWDGIFAGLAAGKYDMVVSSVTITDKRKKTMDFSEPYFESGQALVVMKSSTAKSIADLKGKKVGAQIGTTGAFEVKKNNGVTLKTYDEVGLAFEDMAAGRIDGVVCDTPVAANYALQKAEYKNKFIIAVNIPTKEFYGAAFPKGKKELLEKVNKGIQAVKAKGIDKELVKKWIGTK